MADKPALIENIRKLILADQYRIRIHAVRHMLEEGFTEANIVESITGNSKIIENYPDDSRCLILGNFHFTETTVSPLHVICDYSNVELGDIVTAYIPQRPWWVSPAKRGKIA